MTVYFVSNAGSNTAPYDTEAKAANAMSTIASVPWLSTDTVKVSSTHTETAGVAISYAFPTSPGLKIVSVTFNGAGTGAAAAGGAINVGAANAALTFASGFCYVYGLTLASGTNNSASSTFIFNNNILPTGYHIDGCTISAPSASTSARITIGALSANNNDDLVMKFTNCVFSNGAVKSIVLRCGVVTMDGCSLAGTAPTTVFLPSATSQLNILMTGCDWSGVAWTNLIDVSLGAPIMFVARQCKLRAGFTVTTGTNPGPGGTDVILQDCDSGDVQYSYIRSNWSGTITTSAAIYQDASDGTNSFSLYMVASANASWEWPLISPQIQRFNSGTSAVSATVEVDNDGTTFKDNELWLEVLAKVSTGFPLGTWNRADRSADILNAGTNQDSSSVSWTGTGGFGAEVKQKLVSGSFTPAEVGPVVGVVKLAKAGDDVYVSPHMTLA